MHRIIAHEIIDEPIIFYSDDKSGDDDNFDTGHTSRTLDSAQPGNDVLDLESPRPLSNRTTNEHDNRNDGIDNNKPPHTTKRQRSAPPFCNANLNHASTPPLPHNKDGKDSRENIRYSDRNEPGDEDIWSKRRKVSTSLGGSIDSISANGNLDSTARTTPVFESSPPTEPFSTQVIDNNQTWDVRKIIGKEDVNGELHYWVVWSETLEPKHNLPKALVNQFEARLRAQRGVKNTRGGRATATANASDGQEKKRPRGRRQKQTGGRI